MNVGYPNGSSIESEKFLEVSVNKLKRQGNRDSFKLGSQMDRSTGEVDVMFMEGRILGKY